MTRKAAASKKLPLDFTHYLKLPFEVHYADALAITQFEAMSDVTPSRFDGIKVIFEQGGYAHGVSFQCSDNRGAELIYCLTDMHGEVAPPWLDLIDAEREDFNYGKYYAVTVKNKKIYLNDLSGEEEDDLDLDVEEMRSLDLEVLFDYWIGGARPTHFILDADNSRIKVSPDGYLLDANTSKSKLRLFDNKVLTGRWDEIWKEWYSRGIVEEEICECETVDLFDSQYQWIKRLIDAHFPKDSKLELV